jgi:hypothetical protein
MSAWEYYNNEPFNFDATPIGPSIYATPLKNTTTSRKTGKATSTPEST